MKKTREPTETEIVDFYYWLLIKESQGNKINYQDVEIVFAEYPRSFTTSIDDYCFVYPRETSQETYECYVDDYNLDGIKKHYCAFVYSNSSGKRKHKIKITIEE